MGLISVLESACALLGVSNEADTAATAPTSEPTAFHAPDAADEATLLERLEDARRKRAAAETTREAHAATLAKDSDAAAAAKIHLERLCYDEKPDAEIAAAHSAVQLAGVRHAVSERRHADAADVVTAIDETIAGIKAELAEYEAARTRAKLLEAASIEALRAANGPDEDLILAELPRVLAAAKRMIERFDAANVAAQGAGVHALDSMHAIAGLLTKLAARDPAHAARFIRDEHAFRLSVGVTVPVEGHTLMPISNLVALLTLPNVPVPVHGHEIEDMATLFEHRRWTEAEAAKHAAQNARKAANPPPAPKPFLSRAEALAAAPGSRESVATPGDAPPADLPSPYTETRRAFERMSRDVPLGKLIAAHRVDSPNLIDAPPRTPTGDDGDDS